MAARAEPGIITVFKHQFFDIDKIKCEKEKKITFQKLKSHGLESAKTSLYNNILQIVNYY